MKPAPAKRSPSCFALRTQGDRGVGAGGVSVDAAVGDAAGAGAGAGGGGDDNDDVVEAGVVGAALVARLGARASALGGSESRAQRDIVVSGRGRRKAGLEGTPSCRFSMGPGGLQGRCRTFEGWGGFQFLATAAQGSRVTIR